MKPSGNYDSKPMRGATQADHMRSVTRLAVKIAEEMAGLFPAMTIDRDILIAGCLCHDIGKVWEFDPENVKRWPQAALHTQWPGTGVAGDPAFDQFYASQVASMENVGQLEALMRELAELYVRD